MSESPYVFDASAENFPRRVRRAAEFGGRFLRVMLDTDELGRLAREPGVMSPPTVTGFRHGRVADALHGAESEPVRRGVRRDAGRAGLPALFRLLGADDERVVRDRALLSETRRRSG